METEDAITLINKRGHWSIGRENVRCYLDWHIIALCEQHRNDPAIMHVADFPLLQLHPNLHEIAGFLVPNPFTGVLQLPDPSRPQRYCANAGWPPAMLEALADIWAIVRNAADPLVFPAGWSNQRKLTTVTSRFRTHMAANGIPFPANWVAAAQELRHTHPGGHVRGPQHAWTNLVNMMIRCKVLTAHALQTQTIGAVRAIWLANFTLWTHGPQTVCVPRPKHKWNARGTIDLAALRMRERGSV